MNTWEEAESMIEYAITSEENLLPSIGVMRCDFCMVDGQGDLFIAAGNHPMG
jgi:hypothetical protein